MEAKFKLKFKVGQAVLAMGKYVGVITEIGFCLDMPIYKVGDGSWWLIERDLERANKIARILYGDNNAKRCKTVKKEQTTLKIP